jgi:biotin-[acetyl-CoA-carboxylase] ligase BirA-like protein
MLVLTDCPSETAHLLPPAWNDSSWDPGRGLSQADRDLWGTLSGGLAPWSPTERGPQPAEDFWSRLILITESPASQFDLLQEHLGHCVRDVGPVACVALRGDCLHGLRGRAWSAGEGNLLLSVAIAPSASSMRYALSLTMLPAVAVVEAIDSLGCARTRPAIKWINDVLIEGAKVAGVLTGTQVLRGRLDLAVFGMGVNVAQVPRITPTPFVPRVTCLHDVAIGGPPSLGEVLWALLDALAIRFRMLLNTGASGLFEAYRRLSLVIGRRVRLWDEDSVCGESPRSWPPARISGRVLNLCPDLSLRLDGQADPVCSGRLAFEEACLSFGL